MAKRKNVNESELSSSGHGLGQRVGDWFEEYFVLPLLSKVAAELKLYFDHRFRTRPEVRGDRIVWPDEYGNEVAYDFVMELDGTDQVRGIPVAFFEGCWRRGTRHSKDKARDDVGKLSPMRDCHPTARFLGMLVCGDFTQPARQYVQHSLIDLMYVPKQKVIDAFSAFNVQIDYADDAREEVKRRLAEAFQRKMSRDVKVEAAEKLKELVGSASLNGYTDRVRAALSALPQEIRFIARKNSKAAMFETIEAAQKFLDKPTFDFDCTTEDFVYQITYTDGTDFEREVSSINDVRKLHSQLVRLVAHVTSLTT